MGACQTKKKDEKKEKIEKIEKKERKQRKEEERKKEKEDPEVWSPTSSCRLGCFRFLLDWLLTRTTELFQLHAGDAVSVLDLLSTAFEIYGSTMASIGVDLFSQTLQFAITSVAAALQVS